MRITSDHPFHTYIKIFREQLVTILANCYKSNLVQLLMAKKRSSRTPPEQSGDGEKGDTYARFIEGKQHISIWIDAKEYTDWETVARNVQGKDKPVMAKFVKMIVRDFVRDKSLSVEEREDRLEKTLREIESQMTAKLDNIAQLKAAIPVDVNVDISTAAVLVAQIKGQIAKGTAPNQAIIDCDSFPEPHSVHDSLQAYETAYGGIEFDMETGAWKLTEDAINTELGG